MSELKNKFGDNVSWLLIDVAEQIKCELEDSDTIESGFEIYGETEDGRETQCDIELVDLLESASVEICSAKDQLTAVAKQRDELLELNREFAEFAKRQGWQHVLIDQYYKLEQKGSN